MDQPFRGPLLNRAIQDHLKHYITEHHLQPGDMLPPEGKIAEDLGVGRGSVREAIKALERKLGSNSVWQFGADGSTGLGYCTLTLK